MSLSYLCIFLITTNRRRGAIIAYKHQNKGIGSMLLRELEQRVKEKGASCVELQAVNDDMHERYYGNAGYKNAKNFVMKVKWFV